MISRILVDTPSFLLLLVFIAIGVGTVLVIGGVFYDRFIVMSQNSLDSDDGTKGDEKDEKEGGEQKPPAVPSPFDLRSRVLTFTTLAFVFMLAFVLNTAWSNVQAAQSATQSEGADLARLMSLAQHLEDPARSAAVEAAIVDYTDMIVNEQWPLLQIADSAGAGTVGMEASGALSDAIAAAQAGDETSAATWGEIQSTLTDIGQDSIDRMRELPGQSAPWRIGVVVILGFTMLITTTAFLPTRKGAYLAGVTIMAVLTALLVFAMVQASNPYAQSITPEPIIRGVELASQ